MVKKTIRKRPQEHVRKIKTIGHTKFIIVNKGVKRSRYQKPGLESVTVGDRRDAIKIIKELMSANRSIARRRIKFVNEQAKLRPLSLQDRDRLDEQENRLQRRGRENRSKIKFLEREFDIDPNTKV